MANHHYGFAWPFGIGLCNAEEPGERLGTLRIFDNVQGLKAWIAGDTDRRERIDGKAARHEMVRALHGLTYTHMLGRYDNKSGIERWCPIDEPIDAYRETEM